MTAYAEVSVGPVLAVRCSTQSAQDSPSPFDAPDFGAVLDCYLCQGTTSVVPQTVILILGFSPCAFQLLQARRPHAASLRSITGTATACPDAPASPAQTRRTGSKAAPPRQSTSRRPRPAHAHTAAHPADSSKRIRREKATSPADAKRTREESPRGESHTNAECR